MTTGNSELTSIRPAPMWRRSLAAVADMLIVFYSVYYAANQWGAELPNGGRGWHGWTAVGILCLIGAYWIVPEWLFGFTIGKLLLGIRVLPVAGEKITLSQSLKRNLLRPFDFLFLYLIGFIVAMLSPTRQRLGDQWAHTTVGTLRPALAQTPQDAHV